MWRTVLRLEWRILRRDRAALTVLAIFAAFLVLAAVAGGRQATALEAGLERSLAHEREQAQTVQSELAELARSDSPLGANDPRDPVWMGQDGAARTALLPPAPLASVAVGQRDLHPQAVRVTSGVHLTAERETDTPMSGPTKLTTGAFDPAFLFVVLFPLVIIALSYELLTGERERGTLAMLLSQPVTQTALVLGKAGARAIALCAVTLAFGLVGLVIAGADLGAPGAALHIALYAVVLVAWAIFWFSLAVAVNAWGESSARNALLLVGVWLLLVIVVPGLVSVGVDVVAPAPSRIELMHEAREAARDVEKELDGLQGRHDVDPRKAGYAARVVEVQEELAKRSAPVVTELREQARKRQDLADTLRYLSPALVVQLALEDVAGSGSVRHRRFEEQVDRYHEVFRAWFVDRVKRGARLRPADLASIPTMTFEEEPAGALLLRVLGGVLGLLIGAGALIGVAWPGLQRIGRLTR